MTSTPRPGDTGEGVRRKPIPKRVRFEVLRRDNHTCRYCHATDTPLTIDHVMPTVLGGSDDPSNLVAACKDCNAGKSSSSPDAATVAQVDEDATRWAAAMQEAARRVADGDEVLRDRLNAIRQHWDALVPSYKADRPMYRLPMDWTGAIEGLLTAGFPDAMILDSIDVAMRRPNLDNVFRYMVGVAHNKLAKLQEAARAIVGESSTRPTGLPCPHCRQWHPEPCGWWDGYRIGLVDCSVTHPDTTQGKSAHPDHYLFMALSRVVDASAHEAWDGDLYPTYTGRA